MFIANYKILSPERPLIPITIPPCKSTANDLPPFPPICKHQRTDDLGAIPV